jgi:purine-nucleoside phosphorylase
MQDEKGAAAAAAWIRPKLPAGFAPRAAVILGTGLGQAPGGFAPALGIDYAGIPCMPGSSAPGHAGRLEAGTLAGADILLWRGRFHLYEGYAPAQVCQGVRVSALLGAKTLVVTNAAGSLNPLHKSGEILAITDHVNLTGQNPLSGPNIDAWGPRFPDMSRAYSPRLIELAGKKALEMGMRLERGVYAGVAGPQLETPAETRMLRMLGADAVGMSTVMEVIAARHMGMEVLGLSCLTNQNLPDSMAEISIEDVLAVAARAGEKLGRLLTAVAGEL